ncbi:MAG TPA: peptidoglycan-binding protein [Allocoleopsis sp.]
MESLAYLHLAWAYEAPTDTDTNILYLENLKLFEWVKRQKLASQVRLYLLSLMVILGILGIASETLAQSLRLGAQGSRVTELQDRLRDLGYFYQSSTGRFGSQTQDAVIRFQRASGLNPDGIVGADTQAALFGTGSITTGRQYQYQQPYYLPPPSFTYTSPNDEGETFSTATRTTDYVLQLGDRGSEVRQLQEKLRREGFDPGSIDGIFGPQTQVAVRRFQRANDLFPDGVAGRETLAALGIRPEKNRYVVVVPGNQETLNKVQDVLGFERISLGKSRLGNYVNAGAFPNRDLAESRSHLLRARGLDARVVYR